MRHGSLGFWQHRRAKRQLPRVRSYSLVDGPSFLGFVAFKAGMTHITMTDDSESPSKGSEIARAATVLEIPKVLIYGIRAYKKSYVYNEPFLEVYDGNAAKAVGIKAVKNTDIAAFKKKANEFEDIRALAFFDAKSVGSSNKRVMRFEIPIGGSETQAKMAFVENWLGKELKISDILKSGEYIDVIGITKGKGWAGAIKRFGVAKQPRKATGRIRHVGALGPFTPHKVIFSVPQAGHLGYNYRTELNKMVLKLGHSNAASEINPKGGYPNYGVVKSDYIIVDGSVPGPAKRLLRIRKAMRKKASGEPQIIYTSLESK
jgi:large subunit ribosomal protein L3